MPKTLQLLIFALASAPQLTACDATPVDDDLVLTPGAGASVDVACGQACGEDAYASVRLEYLDRYRPKSEVFELAQYRVDYRGPALSEHVPFFASELSWTLHPGDAQAFTLQIAGTVQRDAMREAVRQSAEGIVAGTATLTFAGRGPDDERIFIEAELPIFFHDGDDDATE
jgi:hypothetical protein